MTNQQKNSKNKNIKGTQINSDVVNVQENQFYFQNSDAQIERTEMYTLLEIIFSKKDKMSEDIDIKDIPAEMNQKLEFNEVVEYKDYFEIVALGIMNMEEVMKDFESSDDIILTIKVLFNKINRNESISSDEKLDMLSDKIQEFINSDYRSRQGNITKEKINSFTIMLMAYCVEICQILINPNSKK